MKVQRTVRYTYRHMPTGNKPVSHQWEVWVVVSKIDLDYQVKVANIVITAGGGVGTHDHLTLVLHTKSHISLALTSYTKAPQHQQAVPVQPSMHMLCSVALQQNARHKYSAVFLSDRMQPRTETSLRQDSDSGPSCIQPCTSSRLQVFV